ncbi:MAG TPA: hypothetical protein VM282_21730 [Acidimicrobiales bacterium]|nr:hypothetical protein [Acidimicrobiales bacterium]
MRAEDNTLLRDGIALVLADHDIDVVAAVEGGVPGSLGPETVQRGWFRQRVMGGVAAAESGDVDVEMTVGYRPFVGAGQSECYRAGESDDREHDVGNACLVA